MAKSRGAGLSKTLISAAPRMAPGAAGSIASRLVELGLEGVWKLKGAKDHAEATLRRHHHTEKAIQAVIRRHVTLSGTQGFITNLGGIATTLLSLPANICGLALVNAHMVGTIAHLRGYDIDSHQVRMAIAMCLLGRTAVEAQISAGHFPSTPLTVATAPMIDPDLDRAISETLATTLSTVVGGKQAMVLTVKKVPVLGGGIGAATDGYHTYEIARYAKSEFPSRKLTSETQIDPRDNTRGD